MDEAKAAEMRKLIFTEVRQAFESFLGDLSKAVARASAINQSVPANASLPGNYRFQGFDGTCVCCNGCD